MLEYDKSWKNKNELVNIVNFDSKKWTERFNEVKLVAQIEVDIAYKIKWGTTTNSWVSWG